MRYGVCQQRLPEALRFLQKMTLDFAKEVPDEHWQFSPHERFAPFCKQLRHVVCVRGFETPLTALMGSGDLSLRRNERRKTSCWTARAG
jgi:hypothetical protein